MAIVQTNKSQAQKVVRSRVFPINWQRFEIITDFYRARFWHLQRLVVNSTKFLGHLLQNMSALKEWNIDPCTETCWLAQQHVSVGGKQLSFPRCEKWYCVACVACWCRKARIRNHPQSAEYGHYHDLSCKNPSLSVSFNLTLRPWRVHYDFKVSMETQQKPRGPERESFRALLSSTRCRPGSLAWAPGSRSAESCKEKRSKVWNRQNFWNSQNSFRNIHYKHILRLEYLSCVSFFIVHTMHIKRTPNRSRVLQPRS